MGFDDAIKKTIKSGKIRKAMPDKVDVKLYRMLIQSLQWISVGYSSALYFAGKKLGKEIISDNIKGNDIRGIVKEIGNFFQTYGIGKLKLKLEEENKIVLQMEDGATSYNMEPIGKPVCFFEAGLIAGIIEAKIKKNVLVKETVCGGLGDSTDEFSVRWS